eukprot:CAMPEP_0201114138 /NCGR_PEP_ID=MMETSP0812-20130820/78225_1 /ASSEMBLY_ACC=CAM_ASM_000668 /TAXON_ID=98059 /ORGANISM="Dinobryon sp., Strain UTEXLB2267" /LENGTH=584 /DNA_ID=CAMNT_0047377737 /DNA_START=252 /DNA_END=2007 /DNA_ORIENTATION=-
MRSGQPGVLELVDWVVANFHEGQTVGLDPFLVSTAQAKLLQKRLAEKNIQLRCCSYNENSNPIDEVWNRLNTRPAFPCNPVTALGINTTGVSHSDKIRSVQNAISKTKAACLLVSMLDEVAWLLNIRGSDIAFNPVTIAYVVVTRTEAILFIDSNKLSPAIISHLGTDISIQPYESLCPYLSDPSRTEPVWMDANKANWGVYLSAESNTASGGVLDMASPIALMKSLKNDSELAGIRACHVRDGVALTAFLHWLETTVRESDRQITEHDVSEKIEEFRSQMAHHVGPSFNTIAGYGPNGAIIHYHAEKDKASVLGRESLFLLDSGAQYLDGTTDITRTIHFGSVSQRMKDCYTLVLKGHIALAQAVFPTGTPGSRLDCLARAALWQQGLDYNHGTGHGVGAYLNVHESVSHRDTGIPPGLLGPCCTLATRAGLQSRVIFLLTTANFDIGCVQEGHGVGAYLNVHEGPQGIGFRRIENEAGFAAGMTISNEPGYYDENNFGIRIENICVAIRKDTPSGKDFLGFDTVSLAPIKTDLVNVAMLSDSELQWLNTYNQTVQIKLIDLMQTTFPDSVQYLLQETKALVR